MSYRLPKLKIISEMTNIITAIILNVFSMPRIMFYVVIKKRVFESRLCRPITFGNDVIMAYQWKKLYTMRPLRSSWYAQLVMKWNIRGARPGCPQVGARARVLVVIKSHFSLKFATIIKTTNLGIIGGLGVSSYA